MSSERGLDTLMDAIKWTLSSDYPDCLNVTILVCDEGVSGL